MRLDACTTEIVAFLRNKGFSVHHPVEITIGEEEATVMLKGGHRVNVIRDESGLRVKTVYRKPEAAEPLTYHDMLVVAIALEKREEAVRTLHNMSGGCADELNNLGHVRRKVSALLRAERSRQYAAETEEAAGFDIVEETLRRR